MSDDEPDDGEEQRPLTSAERTMVERNLGLAYKLANAMWARNPQQLDRDDVSGAAIRGLIKAAQRWDPTREQIRPEDLLNGKAFAGFARVKINGAIMDYLREIDHVSKQKRKDYKLLQSHGHGTQKVSLAELAIRTGMTEDRVRQLVHVVEATTISIDATPDHWEGEHQYGIDLPDRHDVESTQLEMEVRGALTSAVRDLPELQRVVVVLCFFMHLTVPKAAEVLDLRPAQVRNAYTEGVITVFRAIRATAA